MDAAGGFIVPILDDDGAVEVHAAGQGFTVPDDGFAAGDHNRVPGDNYAAVLVAADELSRGGVEDGGGRCDDDAGGYHRALLDDGALVDAAVAADEGIVLDDGGQSARRLKDSPDLGAGRYVDVLPHLRAGADGDVAVHHRPGVHVCANVDVSRGHDDAAGSHVSASAYGTSARDDAHAVLLCEPPHRESVLVKVAELALGHLLDDAKLEAFKDDLLDFPVDFPLAVYLFCDS